MGFECTICSEFLDTEADIFWQSKNAATAGPSRRGRPPKSKNEPRSGQPEAPPAPPAENKKLIVTKCGHIFHKVCLASWLNTSSICPICQVADAHNELRTVYPNLDSNDEQDNLRVQCKTAEIQVKQLKKQNLDLTGSKKKMATDNESLKKKLLEKEDNLLASLKQNMAKKHEKEISKITTNLKLAESNLKVQQEIAEVVKAQLQIKERVIQELRMQDRNNQTKIKEQEEQLKAKKVEQLKMCKQLFEKDNKIYELVEKTKLANQENQMLTEKIANLEIQLTKAKDDSEEKDFRLLVSTMKELNDTKDKLEKANAKANSNHGKCEAKILHLSTALKDANEKIEHLQQEFESKINLASNAQVHTQLELAKSRLVFFEKSMAQFAAFRLEQENTQNVLNNYYEQLKKNPIDFNQSNVQETLGREELGEQPQTSSTNNNGKETLPAKKTDKDKSTLSSSKGNELKYGSTSSFAENSSDGPGSPKKPRMTKPT